MPNIPSSTALRNNFLQQLSTANQLAGFLDGILDGLEHVSAENMTNENLDRLRASISKAQERAFRLASSLSETIDAKSEVSVGSPDQWVVNFSTVEDGGANG